MKINTLGFIGGGRVTRFLIAGLKRKSALPKEVIVSDPTALNLDKLKNEFLEISMTTQENTQPATCDLVFLAVHPQKVQSVLNEIRLFLRPTSYLISLVPKISIETISEGLDGFQNIIRQIPNAASYINQGFNPVSFASGFSDQEKKEILEFLSLVGKCPIVDEENLEAYAIITSMAPAFFWFQLNELHSLGESFGLTQKELKDGISSMMFGSIRMYYESGLSLNEMADLISTQPLNMEEANIAKIYNENLNELYKKLKDKA